MSDSDLKQLLRIERELKRAKKNIKKTSEEIDEMVRDQRKKEAEIRNLEQKNKMPRERLLGRWVLPLLEEEENVPLRLDFRRNVESMEAKDRKLFTYLTDNDVASTDQGGDAAYKTTSRLQKAKKRVGYTKGKLQEAERNKAQHDKLLSVWAMGLIERDPLHRREFLSTLENKPSQYRELFVYLMDDDPQKKRRALARATKKDKAWREHLLSTWAMQLIEKDSLLRCEFLSTVKDMQNEDRKLFNYLKKDEDRSPAEEWQTADRMHNNAKTELQYAKNELRMVMSQREKLAGVWAMPLIERDSSLRRKFLRTLSPQDRELFKDMMDDDWSEP